MKNPRITAKERGLIKGALRRAFSRSDLHRKAVDATRVEYEDTTRPRVKKWSICTLCKQHTPTYLIEVDHKLPIVPVNTTFEDMSLDDLINNLWCELTHLQGICHNCHIEKGAVERKARSEHKAALKVKKKRRK